MCGIFAQINPIGKTVRAEDCRRATNLLFHRGPDSYGEWASSGRDVFLGFRRLSILDLSDRANQPMCDPNGSDVLVFNGEIYNFRELRKELASLGCTFRSDGDTEVLLQALAHWGEGALCKLEGMFALVHWNSRTRSALIVRDFLGIKPVYVWESPAGGICVASELKAFYAMQDFEPRVNRAKLPEYLRFRGLCGDQTLLHGVTEVQPGHLIRYDQAERRIVQRRYWSPQDVIGSRSFTVDALDSVTDSFRRSVEAHVIADVPVGTQFSGGVDSTLVAAVAHRDLKLDIHGFHCGIDDVELGETAVATAAASDLGIELRVTEFTEEVFLSELFEKLTWHRDEPVGHPNTVGVYLVSALARPEVKVLLSGEGADEIFGGYPRYSNVLRNCEIRKWPLVQRIVSNMPARNLHFYKSLQASANWLRMPLDLELVSRTQFSEPGVVETLLQSPSTLESSLEGRFRILGGITAEDTLSRHQIFDVLTYLPSLLVRQDKMSMAASIEDRVPFVTPGMLAIGLNLPAAQRATSFRQKTILKRMLQKYLPKSSVYRKKVGFGVPIQRWLSSKAAVSRIEKVLSASPIAEYLDPKAVQAVLTTFKSTGEGVELVWLLFTFAVWLRIFTSKDRVCGAGSKGFEGFQPAEDGMNVRQ